MVQMIKAVDGAVEVREEMAGALKKRGTTTAEVADAIADATLVAEQRKCDLRQLVISCLVGLKVEATRNAIAATAAALRTAGAVSSAPVPIKPAGDSDAALRVLAAAFGLTLVDKFLKMARPEVKADPQAAKIAVEAVGPHLREKLTPKLTELRAFAWKMLTQPDIWHAANEDPSVIAAIAAFRNAAKKTGAPDPALAAMIVAHEKLKASLTSSPENACYRAQVDLERASRQEIIDYAAALLPEPVEPQIKARMLASGMVEGTLAYRRAFNYHRAVVVIEATECLADIDAPVSYPWAV